MMCSMALIERWRPEPWTPTSAQEETALHLSDNLVGARGRTRADGTAELRTVNEGEVRRYLIHGDGTAKLLEARPTSGTYRRAEVVQTVAARVAIVAVVGVIVTQALNFPEEIVHAAVALVCLSLLALFVGEIVMNREIEVPGEQWRLIGGADD
jgi:hypothetical protein